MLDLARGLFFGTLFGIIPGLHPNLAISFAPVLAGSDPVGFMAGFSVANLVFDSVPSVLVGVAEEGREISSFKSKSYYLHGIAEYGIRRSAKSVVLGFFLSVLLLPVLLPAVSVLHQKIYRMIPYIVLGVTLINIIPDFPQSVLLFAMSGILGFMSLKISASNITPLLTGLFGMPLIMETIIHPPGKIPQTSQVPIHKPFRGLTRGVLFGSLAGLLPALGPSQLVFLGAFLPFDYIVFSSGIAASNTIYSVASLATIGKARSGIAVFLQDTLGSIIFNDIIRFALLGTLSAGISGLVLHMSARKIVEFSEKIGQVSLSLLSMAIIVSIVFATAGEVGEIVLLSATSLGMYAFRTDARKAHLLGCLIYPTLVYYFFGII